MASLGSLFHKLLISCGTAFLISVHSSINIVPEIHKLNEKLAFPLSLRFHRQGIRR